MNRGFLSLFLLGISLAEEAKLHLLHEKTSHFDFSSITDSFALLL